MAKRLTKEQVREALIIAGNERLQAEECAIHNERAFLSAATNPSHIVISGCCTSFIERAAYAMGFRAERTVDGGRPTLLLSAGLQVL